MSISSWLNHPRLWIVALITMLSLTLGSMLGLFSKFDAIFIFSLLTVVCGIGYQVFLFSLNNTLLLSLSLQLVTFFVFFEAKFLKPFLGAGLQLYVMLFGLATLVSAVHLVRHFRYLWDNFLVFRLLLIFFAVTMLYLLLGHFSDFRLNTDRQSFDPSSGSSNREFGAFAAYVLHIEALTSIVPITIGLMLSRHWRQMGAMAGGLLLQPFQLITMALTVYFLLDLAAVVVGTSPALYHLVGAANNEAPFLIPLFIALTLACRYLFTYSEVPVPRGLLVMADFNVVFALAVMGSALNISGGSSMIMGSFIATFAFVVGMRMLGYNPVFFAYGPHAALQQANPRLVKRDWLTPLLKTSVIVGVMLVILGFTALRLEDMAANDSHSVDLRFAHWGTVINSWENHVTPTSFLLGFGLDSSREAVYFGSFTAGKEKGIPSTHNMYLTLGYDYGLMSLLFHAAVFSSLLSAFRLFTRSRNAPTAAVLSVFNMAFILSTGFMFMFLDSTVILRITYFSVLAFCEAAKFALAPAAVAAAAPVRPVRERSRAQLLSLT